MSALEGEEATAQGGELRGIQRLDGARGVLPVGEQDQHAAFRGPFLEALDRQADRIPDGGPYYFTIDADGLDPTIMPAVMAQTPGGVTWHQMRKLIHGLVKKGRVLGMDLVEIAPSRDVGTITMVHAERIVCNFIGAAVRAGYCD